MTALTSQSRGQLLNRGPLLEYITVGWNIIEGIVAAASWPAALLREGWEAWDGEDEDHD